MSVKGALARGNRAAVARMTATCVVRRKTGATTTDDRGLEVPEWAVVYSGVCRVGGITRGQGPYYTQNVAGELSTRANFYLCLPAAVNGSLRENDVAEVTGDGGGLYVVLSGAGKSQSVEYRPAIEETTRPAEWDA